jgi:Bardet-Biedl syndrome 2 protein
VGYEGSQHYHVFELTRQLPRFAMYAVLVERTQDVDSFVSFVINERLQRVSFLRALYLVFCEVS